MNIAPHKEHKRPPSEIFKSIENNKPRHPRSSGDFKYIVLFPSHQKQNKLVDNYEWEETPHSEHYLLVVHKQEYSFQCE